MTRLKLRVFILLGLGFVALVWWVNTGEFRAIDACLDAGGRWDYDAQVCDGG